MGSNREYTQEFRINAVRLVTEDRVSARAAAHRLGVGESTIWKWVKKAERERWGMSHHPGESQKITPDTDQEREAELAQLCKENGALKAANETLKMEVDFAQKSQHRVYEKPRTRCAVIKTVLAEGVYPLHVLLNVVRRKKEHDE